MLLQAGYAPDQQGLIYIKKSIPNFVQFQERVPCYGWSIDPVNASDICTWNGVGCNNALQVTSVVFPNNASLLTGAIMRADCEVACLFSSLPLQKLVNVFQK